MYQNLFTFLSESHNLTLLGSEMDDLLNHILGAVVRADGRYGVVGADTLDGTFRVWDDEAEEFLIGSFAQRHDAEVTAMKLNYEYGSTL